jgi:N-acetylglucosamine-6-phosphate deacetylase
VYRLGRAEITVTGGTARVGTGEPPAGGTRSLLDVVRCAVESGVDLAGAVLSATAVPAGVLGLADELGSLRTGLRADAVVVSAQLELLGVLRAGTWLRVPGVREVPA